MWQRLLTAWNTCNRHFAFSLCVCLGPQAATGQPWHLQRCWVTMTSRLRSRLVTVSQTAHTHTHTRPTAVKHTALPTVFKVLSALFVRSLGIQIVFHFVTRFFLSSVKTAWTLRALRRYYVSHSSNRTAGEWSRSIHTPAPTRERCVAPVSDEEPASY